MNLFEMLLRSHTGSNPAFLARIASAVDSRVRKNDAKVEGCTYKVAFLGIGCERRGEVVVQGEAGPRFSHHEAVHNDAENAAMIATPCSHDLFVADMGRIPPDTDIQCGRTRSVNQTVR